jgi:hypothetical protein
MNTVKATREESGKISKAAALYIFRPDTQYTCGDCPMLKNGDKCAWLGPTVTVSAKTGTCGYFAHGKPLSEIPWLPLFTKEELGYAENAQGFSCKRCEEFVRPADCQKVHKDSPGDTPGQINLNACCALWNPDPKRAKMTNEQLFVILERK